MSEEEIALQFPDLLRYNKKEKMLFVVISMFDNSWKEFFMYKKILVPHDGSTYSEKAIVMASDLAKLINADIKIVQVLPEPFPAASVPLVGDIVTPDTTPEIDKAKTIIDKDVKVTYCILRGNPADVILQAAIDDGSDLIIMGSRGVSGFSGLLLGSVSNKVAQLSKVPVLLAK